MTIGKRITVGFVIPVVLLLTVGLLARTIIDRQNRITGWVEHTQEVRLELQRLLTRVVDAESGARAYFFIGDEAFLEHALTAESDTTRILDHLSALTQDNPEEHARVETLATAAASRLHLLAAGIEKRHHGPFDDATARTLLGDGKQAMDTVRADLAKISEVEAQLLGSRKAQADETSATSQTVLLVVLLMGLLVSIGSSLIVARSILRPLGAIREGVTKIGNGELAHRIGSTGKDELGQLASVFDDMAARRQQSETDITARADQRAHTLKNVAEIATRLASSAEELAATTASQASGAQEQSAAVAETVTIVEQVVQTSIQASERAQTIAAGAREAASAGQVGQDSLGAATATMESARQQATRVAESILALAEHAQAIEEIISSVDDLAEQSNMLALNAAIEASRAGEYGRGFGVVAAEMKALADASKAATVQVRRILGTIQKQSNQTVMMSESSTRELDAAARAAASVQAAMRSLAEAISNMATASAQIAASSRQQSGGLQQINQAMRDVAGVAAQNLATTRQIGEAAKDLTSLGTSLKRLFSDKVEERPDGRA